MTEHHKLCRRSRVKRVGSRAAACFVAAVLTGLKRTKRTIPIVAAKPTTKRVFLKNIQTCQITTVRLCHTVKTSFEAGQ